MKCVMNEEESKHTSWEIPVTPVGEKKLRSTVAQIEVSQEVQG